MIERDELSGWLRLLAVPGAGRQTAREWLAAQGSLEALLAGGQLPPADESLQRQVDAALAWLASGNARHVLTLADAAYPQALLQTADPPLLLYVQGRLELLNAPALAIVGSRNPTPQGRDNAHAFAAHLSSAGLTVVSGLALGIDGAAHEGGLEGSGSTIAVVGTGLDRVYPSRHRALAHRIAEAGALLSEFPLGTEIRRENFPQRNRIIAGLSLGTLVVEAAQQSGSLITARQAADAGREVFAIPGSIHSPQSRGCHLLIKQGAKLVETAQDVLDELRIPDPGVPPVDPPGTPETDAVLSALGHDPATLDTLLDRTGLPVSQLNARLLELELQGRVARLGSGMFQRRANA